MACRSEFAGMFFQEGLDLGRFVRGQVIQNT